jgi:hypothetical protein
VERPAAELYAERERRFNDVVALRKPDRVPVIPMVNHYFPTKLKGVSNMVAGYDSALRYSALREATVQFGWDMGPSSGVFSSKGFDALGTLQIRWPGGALKDDAPFQFVEGEYVREEEYEEFLSDPNGFTLTKIFPRIAGNLEGFGHIPFPLYWLSNAYFLQAVGGPILSAPPLCRALRALLDLADAAEEEDAILADHIEKLASMGLPFLNVSVAFAAFDLVSDFFRGLRGGSLDIYRNPEKLQRAIDLMQPACIALAIGAAKMSGNPRVFIPMHRGADIFMSEEAFERFYWPTFKELIEALVANDLAPMPLFEGGYTSRLKYLAQLPPGKVAGHFENVDHRKFKDLCGDMMCFWGNVPSSIMCTGTPQQVKDNVKRLIDFFGDTGAFIVDANQGIPDESRPENVMALREAVDEYGVF